MIATAAIVWLLASAQDPEESRRARPVRVQNDVRIIIEETPREEFEHDYYEQALPVEVRSGTPSLSSRVWYRTICRPQDDDPRPIFLRQQPPGPSLPLSLTAGFSLPTFSVTAGRNLIVGGRPRIDPIITKPALFGGGGSDTVTSSDTPLLYGPDLDLIVDSDLSTWMPTQWLPAQTSLHFYARALFGSFEVFDTPTSLQLYGIGPRLLVPLARSSSLELAVTISAGPAFLHTGIGDAAGFDGGIGIRLEHFFSPAFSFLAAAEANLYFSETVTAFGPIFNLGFNLSW
jgi:hypothetical protein